MYWIHVIAASCLVALIVNILFAWEWGFRKKRIKIGWITITWGDE